jgi:hypothetical protein
MLNKTDYLSYSDDKLNALIELYQEIINELTEIQNDMRQERIRRWSLNEHQKRQEEINKNR